MLIVLTILCIFYNTNVWAQEFKVMSFNTMCDFCSQSNFESYEIRKKSIKNIIETANADLYSLQEVRSAAQVEYFFSNRSNFELIYWKSFLFTYADPALAINKQRFEIIENGYFWLGPNQGNFSFGWKYALPRLVQWVELRDKIKNINFIFIGSHFDNRVENMIGSAKAVNQFIKDKKLPVIFAADTNCTIDFQGYSHLRGNNLQNSFQKKHIDKNLLATNSGKDLCYLRKGDQFPECRVDHILFSKNGPWIVKDWTINTYKRESSKNYSSDHRPIMATFTY